MGLFADIKTAWKVARTRNVPGMENVLKSLDFFSYSGNGCTPSFCVNLSSLDGIEEAYNKCEPLSTVIGRNAMSLANAKWWITDNKDNDKSAKYPQVYKLLKQPNPIQSWTEFIIQLDVYRQLYGEVFIWAGVGVGADIQNASALWVIKPDYIFIEQTNKLYFQNEIDGIVGRYYLTVGGAKVELNKDYLLHIKDIYQNLNFCPTDIRGASRLEGLENPIKNIVQAYEAMYSLNKDRGAQGILSNEKKDALGTAPMTPLEKEEIGNVLKDNYGLLKHQLKVIVTDASLKWQQMSFNVKDLMLFEGIEDNIKRISDAFGYPYELLSTTKGVTFANKKEAKAWHYQDTIIPIAQLYGEKFSSFFNLTSDLIIADFSNVEALKKSESEKADTLYKMNQAMKIAYDSNIVSLEEWRLQIGMDEKIYGTTMKISNNEQDNQDTAKVQ